METKILRVVRQGEAFSVQSSKSDNGSIQKCNIVLRELGGSKFENEYVCAMLGNLAACKFYEGDVVAATLRFSTHEYQGQTFQEILATDVATALGYANTRKAVLDHVDKEDREDGVTIRDAIVGCTLRMLNEPAEDTLTATQVAKTFNMTVFDFNHVLSDMGIQYRRGGHWNISDDLALSAPASRVLACYRSREDGRQLLENQSESPRRSL